MLYVDEEFYLNIFRGEPVQEADFPALEERAAELIEEMCRYRINPENFTSYSERIQMLIKKAVCAEIEYLDANGGSEMDNGADLQSAGLGKFSFTKTSSEASSEQSLYAPRARRLLAPTGLLYRGGGSV